MSLPTRRTAVSTAAAQVLIQHTLPAAWPAPRMRRAIPEEPMMEYRTETQGGCVLCGKPLRDGETVVMVVEDRHPTYDREVVLDTYHQACCRNREQVGLTCEHCGCVFHLALIRRGERHENRSGRLFCPFCSTLSDRSMIL